MSTKALFMGLYVGLIISTVRNHYKSLAYDNQNSTIRSYSVA